MLPPIPSLLLFLLLAGPARPSPTTSTELQVRGERTPRDAGKDSIKVVISEGCATQGDSDVSQGGKEIDLAPGSPLVLTHKIKLVPSGSGSGSGSCGCEAEFAALRERVERLEREVSDLREKCGGAGGSCCTSESKGAGCSIKPETDECPNECSDQGRCVDGKCVCFPGHSGPDCSESECPGNCNNNGRCVNGQCICDPGFSGPDCSQTACPDNCSNQGRCVKGKCVCDSGFTGPSCSDRLCPRNCNKRGRCVNGQCECNPGFTGPDCSKRSCPDNCNNRGRCVNGKCVCDSGFTGADCSEMACPGNCNNRGRCINGQCVCDEGFTGQDCSEKTCPNDCNNRGRCVNGKCVCDSDFTGDDCSEMACPGNCNNRGRCINGQCVCDEGFTGADCSEKACPNNCNNRGRCVNGKCVCDSDFTGDDCSEMACPGNCNNRGRCINGQCVCDEGFTGQDCSEKTCPNDCNDRGRCVNGECVCDTGFSGDDCAEISCPDNCNNRGRCINGQCVCDEGFTGADCSEKACPNNCSNRGKCVNGKCVCDVGFAGPACAAKGCPNNCNNKGRCIKGSCVCRRGFTGPDCSQCQQGLTGPNCDIAMSGVSQLSTRDITESSVTLVWTPPPVQYDVYHITFSSQKDREQQITVQVEGSLTSFTQTGLAAGQEYSVSIVGEINGRRGAESTAEFITLISGPTNLKVVKTTSTSAVVQWEESQGEIDRYQLTITPNDGAGRSQKMTIAAGQNSAHIRQLEAGRLYDILLVAEKGTSQSQPATTQVVPGNTFPRGTPEDSARQVTDVRSTSQGLAPSSEVQVINRLGGRQEGSEADSEKVRGSDSATVIARTKPLVGKPERRPQIPGERPSLPKSKLVNRYRNNATKVLYGLRNVAPGSERRNGKNPAVIPGKDSGRNRQSGPDERTAVVDPKKQSDVGAAGQGDETNSDSLEPTEIQNQERKCVNKMKVTHIRFPLKGKVNGCRENGEALGGTPVGSDPNSTPPPGEMDQNNATKSLLKLLTDNIDSLNVTMFSVHLSKPFNLSEDAETMKNQILRGMKPFSSSSSSLSTSQSLSRPTASESPSSSASKLSSSEMSSSASSLPSASSPPPPPPPPPSSSPPSSSASSDDFSSLGSNKLNVDESRTTPDGKTGPSGEGGSAHSPQKRLHQNSEELQNKTHQSGSILLHSPDPLSQIPKKEVEPGLLSAEEVSSSSSSSSSSASDEFSLKLNTAVNDTNGDVDGATTPESSEAEQNRKTLPIKKGPFQRPTHNPPPKWRYPGRAFSNRTRLNLRPSIYPSRPLNTQTDLQKEQVFPAKMPNTSPPVSKGSRPFNPVPVREGSEGGAGTRIPTKLSAQLNQTARGNRFLPSSHPNIRRQPPFRKGGAFQNKTHASLRPPPRGGPPRAVTPASQNNQLGKDGTPENQPEEKDHASTRRLQIPEMSSHSSKEREEDNALIQPDEATDSQIHKEGGRTVGNIGEKEQGSSAVGSGPVTVPKKPSRTITTQQHGAHGVKGSKNEELPETNHLVKSVSVSETGQTEENATDVNPSGVTREPLDFVGVTNRTSDGFTLEWDSAEGKYDKFVVSRTEVKKDKKKERKQDKDQHSQEPASESGGPEDNNRIPENVSPAPKISGTESKPADGNQTFKKVLPGSARSLRFEDLPPQTEYTLTLLGKSPGLLSRLHKLVISTGPEPPTNIVFSKVTENSLTVSWTKPKSSVSGFKVTYTHADDGEPVSVTMDSEDSSLNLSQLSPGSSYEVTIISTLGLDESDPIRDYVMTLPDPPTDLRAVNVTDTTALLLWRPALATIDKYAIIYGSGTDSELRITVSGNAAEQQLSGLKDSTTYTVTITSQLGSMESSPATTTFTTTSGRDSDGPRDLQASNVTPRTAMLSWKPASKPVGSYILTYQTEGQEIKEVIVDATVTQYSLTRLYPGSLYRAELKSSGGEYVSTISTEFTTGTLRFPFPTDCSQELLNGIHTSGEVEIFPQGKFGTSMMVYCDMETDGGGWMVFQRRKDGSVDFFRGWKDYLNGFGDLNGEFWLGLEKLRNLTMTTKMNLRVDLRDEGKSVFAKYSTFEVGKRNYRLAVGGYSGTAGDSLTYHNNAVFSTKDRDPMPFITRCAMSYRGGWWYKNCHEANLNGLYGIDVKHQGVIWTSWKGKEHSIEFSEMKMRPAAFRPPARG